MKTNDALTWYASLNHGGLLIAPSRLPEFFPETPTPLSSRAEERLRRALIRVQSSNGDAVQALLDTVLEEVIGLGRRYDKGSGQWLKGSSVSPEWTRHAVTGEAIKPRRVWQGPKKAVLPVFFNDEKRIGIGRGRRSAARVVEWLRHAEHKVALLTNARQWRLIYAGLDFDAYAEADSAFWFQEGDAGLQVTALRTLLSPAALSPDKEGVLPPLLNAIETSRKGQAELSAELGERCRQAVELLIQAHGDAITKAGLNVATRNIYLAATRVVMRMVVVLFAEARNLLPQDNPIYHDSYGLQGLRESLDRVGGGAGAERLRHRYAAWARVLSLFRLVYEGSPHESLPILRYGGGLFEPGTMDATEPVLRALSLFEDLQSAPTDDTVHRVLNLLTRSRVKVRQGKRSTWIEAPVDFSDLSSEYIGILYEGLLNYELRRVEKNDPVVFLALGDEPALPLSRLESMDDKAVASLVEKAKKGSTLKPSGDESGEEEEEESEEEIQDDEGTEEEAEEEEAPAEGEAETADDKRQAARERAQAWARRAVTVGKLVAKPGSKKADALRAHQEKVEKTASGLIKRTILPGEWFLVRFGGTRKGTGTFYTRPQLAVPMVQRTLRPLAFDPPKDTKGNANEDAPAAEWTPKTPEEILALKVCDPACGSGSFLVASLRFLTEALAQSLHHHKRIEAQGENTLVTLAEGKPETGLLSEETLPCRPEDADFDERLRARLKRYVVEHCIYGVDIDLLAIELCRLSLWVETMDRTLPFSFLDHKIKCGNSLVGCWFDRFRDYPALAWEREGGDKNHTKAVHFIKDAWTKAIKAYRKKLKPALAEWITGQRGLFEEVEGKTPEEIHDEALEFFRQMHALPIWDAQGRADFYREKIEGSQALQRLKEAFNTWCSLWLWPADQLESAPLPKQLANPSEEARVVIQDLNLRHRFFHWELEFPDVFAKSKSGFDSVVGNPPWEIQKPNSKEFFSNLDPLYRGYGKQEALDKQQEYFGDAAGDEKDWLLYNARFKALSNWKKNVASPFGDGENDGAKFNFGKGSENVHSQWHSRRAGRTFYADRKHPFRWQGSADINTYKMFLEAGHTLLRLGGQMGLLVPSGIYTDKGSTDLRKLFLTRCRWRWLFGFENRDGIFDIHRSFKFCPVILEKGGTTDAIKTAFMHRDLSDWAEADRHVIPYRREQLERFSPKTRAILEIRHPRDLEVLEKIYSNSVLLGDDSDDGWKIKYATEFHMTNDSHLFPPRPQWEAKGYKPDPYGRWIGPDAHSALPLYQGVMVGQLEPNRARWVSGSGNRAVWEKDLHPASVYGPQFLISEQVARSGCPSV